MYTDKELEYATCVWEHYQKYGNNIPDSAWEKIGAVRKRMGISWGRGHAIAKEVEAKGDPQRWIGVPLPIPTEVLAGKELEYALAVWEQYQVYGNNIPDKVWSELGKLREGFSISWGRGHAISKDVERFGDPRIWMVGKALEKSARPASAKPVEEGSFSSDESDEKEAETDSGWERDEDLSERRGDPYLSEDTDSSLQINLARSGRRRQAQQDLGLDDEREQERIERAMQKEEERRQRKEKRRREIEESSSYQATQSISKYMDKYFLDPILGFFIPGLGDLLTSVLVVPYIYVSAAKIRSLPLTLAIIFNVLRDVAIGLIPMWIGDALDCVNRGYLQNTRLIVGFVEDDKEVIEKVNKKAGWMGVMIVIFCFIIYLLWKLAFAIAVWIGDLWDSILSFF